MNYDIPGVTTYEFTKIVGLENIHFGTNIIIDDFTFVYASGPMRFGNYVHIASFASVTGGAQIEFGDFVAVSQGARVLAGTDDFVEWGLGNSTVPAKFRNVKRAPIHVGRFCILGANSVILPGVRIGEGAMVGANATITRDLEPWGVYVANGKRIRDRDQKGVMRNYALFCEETGYDQAIR